MACKDDSSPLISGEAVAGDEEEDAFGHVGIDSITKAILRLYPTQKNHLQATAQCKYWLGGPDPLDYISMLYNAGDSSRRVPAHWHYVSFGFSDLHGDNRVHEFTGPGQQSGFGFELTFRLKAKESDESAPMWPASLMNALARYVFQTGNTLNCGDHVPWNRPLDDESASPIQHMLIVADPQLGTQHSSCGNFQFRQLIGVTESEMKAAQHWKGGGVLDCLAKVKEAGGPQYVTDMQRKKSIFDIDVKNRQVVISGVEKEGSNLGHVTVMCRWEDLSQSRRVSGGSHPQDQENSHETMNLEFDLEAAELLPLVLKGRLLKGRYFMFQNVEGQVIIFVPSTLTADMVVVSEECPIKSQGQILQIFCCEKLIQEMSQKFAVFQNPHQVKRQLPVQISLGPPYINIIVLPTNVAT